jgi:HTH-type transcriptional regulator/antitoxin HigA
MIATAIEKYIFNDTGAPRIITSEAQHEQYVSALLELDRRSQLTAAEKNFAELLTLLIEAYEEKHHPIRSASPVEVLQELLSANNLRQKDLVPQLGSESIVSEILSGKRELNKSHIAKLSKRFNVSPEVFF